MKLLRLLTLLLLAATVSAQEPEPIPTPEPPIAASWKANQPGRIRILDRKTGTRWYPAAKAVGTPRFESGKAIIPIADPKGSFDIVLTDAADVEAVERFFRSELDAFYKFAELADDPDVVRYKRAIEAVEKNRWAVIPSRLEGTPNLWIIRPAAPGVPISFDGPLIEAIEKAIEDTHQK